MVKEKIRMYYKIIKKKIQKRRLKRAKLGATYSIFNGEEILPFSLKSIRKNVDYINVVYQKVSWTGKECDSNLVLTLEKLKEDGLIDNIIEYKMPININKSKIAKLVIKKKMLGIKDLQKNNCTHCMILDADELYNPKQLESAKEFVIINGITHSACNLYDYKYYPEIRCRDAAFYSVPFIFKLRLYSGLSAKHNMPCKVDDLRTFKYNKYFDKFYFLNFISMNHMTGLRKCYSDKLEASVTNFAENGREYIEEVKKRDRFERGKTINELLKIEINENGGYIKVDNYFNIDIDYER